MSVWGAVALDQINPPASRSVSGGLSQIEQPHPASAEMPPRRVITYAEPEIGNVLYARDVLLRSLEQVFVLESRAEIDAFLRSRPTAIGLLLEASAHIDEAFGPGRVKAIRLVHDSSSGAMVFGIIFWTGTAESGRDALRHFDQRWWLRNCNRAGGAVNFNVELI